MGRRIFAGLIALASFGHMVVLLAAMAMGWFPLEGSMLLLTAALVLALFAFASAIWVLRTEGSRDFAKMAELFFECHECGCHRSAEDSFCTRCGAHC